MSIMKKIKLVRPCSYDRNSVSLFDAGRKNMYGEMHCVESGILERKVDEAWRKYTGERKPYKPKRMWDTPNLPITPTPKD